VLGFRDGRWVFIWVVVGVAVDSTPLHPNTLAVWMAVGSTPLEPAISLAAVVSLPRAVRLDARFFIQGIMRDSRALL